MYVFLRPNNFFNKLQKRRNAEHLLLNSVGLVPATIDLDINTVMRGFSKGDSNISGKYSLSLSLVTRPPIVSLTGQDYCPFKEKICNVDAPHHLALVVSDSYEGHIYSAMIAVIGFELRGSSVIVYQIQGGRIKPKEDDKNIEFKKHVGKVRKWILSRLNWEQLLVYVIEEWARLNGFSKVKIQCADDNTWRQETQAILNIQDSSRNERIDKHYDQIAEISGYRRGMNYWNKTMVSV
jgi:hypothetical protein